MNIVIDGKDVIINNLHELNDLEIKLAIIWADAIITSTTKYLSLTGDSSAEDRAEYERLNIRARDLRAAIDKLDEYRKYI